MDNMKHLNFKMKLLFSILYISNVANCDWISEWMHPLQKEFFENKNQTTDDNLESKIIEDEVRSLAATENIQVVSYAYGDEINKDYNVIVDNRFEVKKKLEETLKNAKTLAETLKIEIDAVTLRENVLKEAIANGRYGVSTVTVTTSGREPRNYIIRDGLWSLCNSVVQHPVTKKTQSSNLFEDLFSAPRCIGDEVPTARDNCVFNSVTKYETIPIQRSTEYVEDLYFCLKNGFNNTLDHYRSVPRKIINETCQTGIVRSIIDNIQECGVRVLSEYAYFPHRSSAAALLPLEYCTEPDDSCKLIMAWHISSITVENFEFLRNERNFVKYFIKSGPYLEHIE